MKNFEMKYPVEGTSALKAKPDTVSAQHARIIAFPEARARHAIRVAPAPIRMDQGSFAHRAESRVSSAMAGTVYGLPFGRMQRWQAVAGGFALTALAFGGLLLSL